MARYVVALGLILALGSALLPSHAAGSLGPSSVNLGWGYTRDLGPYSDSFTPVPSLDATWAFGRHWAVRSGVTYLRERTFLTTTSAATERGHFVPLSTGLRFYAGGNDERTRGLFLEAAPAAYLAWFRTGAEGKYRMRVLAGTVLGVGVRFAGVGGSRAELGFKYYQSEAAGQWNYSVDLRGFNPNTTEVSAVHHPGLGVFTAYVALGLGD